MAGNWASEGSGPRGAIRFGRRYAETDERYHEHLLERQLDALAREDEAAHLPRPVPEAKAGKSPAARPGELGEAAPQEPVLRQAVIEAGRRVDEVAAASRALLRAARALARLPLETLRNWRRRARRRPGWT